MAGNSWFQFKQFIVIQEKAAMKVGTDAVLLGAWTDVSCAGNILDVGTGTGIIALMLAQRSDAQITAIEIEKNAAEEAAENARNSKWAEKISVENTSFQEFAKASTQKFDCIVSNPPFFSNNIKSASRNLAMARHNDLLSLSDLVKGALKLLSENGKLSLIFPVETALKFADLAAKNSLYLVRQTEVSPTPKNPTHRHLLEFSRKQLPLKNDVLNIRTDGGLDFSAEYKQLTRDFYLKL
ncbi:MAG TPA: methyltransferase [Tangfeifania sp.]|nr:methyltransferase [Tangfeifania sp.]